MRPTRRWRPTLPLAIALAAGAAGAEPQSYDVDASHAAVVYEIGRLGTGTDRGRIGIQSGRIEIDRAAKTGSVDIRIDTSAVDTGVAAFDRCLTGKDFLDVSNYPTAHFVAERIDFDGDKPGPVTGRLTLRDQTHPVTLTALRFNCYTSPLISREVCGGDFEATLQRSQWGLGWGLDQGLPDRVHLLIQVEAIRQ